MSGVELTTVWVLREYQIVFPRGYQPYWNNRWNEYSIGPQKRDWSLHPWQRRYLGTSLRKPPLP